MQPARAARSTGAARGIVDRFNIGENVNTMRIFANSSGVSSGTVRDRQRVSPRKIVFILFDGAQLLDVAGVVVSFGEGHAEGPARRWH